jgi:hypothetical protein
MASESDSDSLLSFRTVLLRLDRFVVDTGELFDPVAEGLRPGELFDSPAEDFEGL